MTLPSVTTAFCLSAIAGLALTSAAMPPIGDEAASLDMRCQASTRGTPCAPLKKVVEMPGNPSGTASDAKRLRGHCQKIAAKAKEQMPMELAANCADGNTASAGRRLD